MLVAHEQTVVCLEIGTPRDLKLLHYRPLSPHALIGLSCFPAWSAACGRSRDGDCSSWLWLPHQFSVPLLPSDPTCLLTLCNEGGLINVAKDKVATQSSTHYGAIADRAVDGR